MRTTIRLDDDVLGLARAYAESRSLGLGRAVSDLVRRGLAADRPVRIVNGLHVFDLPADSRTVSTKMVRELEHELE